MMLDNRILKPSPNETLFHYCSVQTLQAILSTKTMRLSDINMMNDFNETQYGYAVFEEAASEILGDPIVQKTFPDFNKDFFDEVDAIISPLQLIFHPVVACFSRKPDVLSQWTRYANDGTGFAIGFDANLLSEMPVTILEVEYERKTQVKEVREALSGLFMYNKMEKLNFKGKFKQECALFATMLFAYKSEGFREEQEVRLVHLLDVVTDDDRPRLFDAGGVSGGRNVKGQPVKYRIDDGGGIIGYIDLPFPVKKNRSVVNEIWFGPRNNNGSGNLLYMASAYGFKDYAVHHSRITYRR